jgi:renalase
MRIHQDAHHWLFSATPLSIDRLMLFDPDSGVVCGEWLAGGRVEGAFCSGIAAAGYLLRYTGIPLGKERSKAQLVKQ